MPPTIEETLKKELSEIKGVVETTVDAKISLFQQQIEKMSSEIIKLTRENRRMNLRQLHDSDKGASVLTGPYEGMDEFDLQIARSAFKLASDEAYTDEPLQPHLAKQWHQNLEMAETQLAETLSQALDPETPGAGQELTFTGKSSTMWRDVHLATAVSSLFTNFMMPTQPYQVPFDFGDFNWFRGRANIAPVSTDVATGDRTFSAQEIVAHIAWSYDLTEDAVIASMPELRRLMVRNAAEVLDDVHLHGDNADVGANINYDGGASGAMADAPGLDHFLVFDGLMKRPLISNTGQTVNHSGVAPTDAMYNLVRSKLGKYGIRPSDLAYIVDMQTYLRSLAMDKVRTLDDIGTRATILTGMLGSIEGVPIIVSEQMQLADGDGKVTAAGNSTDRGRLFIVNRNMYRIGYRRRLLIEALRDGAKRQSLMVCSMRCDIRGRLDPDEDTACALVRNISID